MADEATNREAFRIQAFYCENMAAPTYAAICRAIANGLTRESRTGAAVLDWPGEPTRDALPLRLMGGLHALVMAGADDDLARIFAGSVSQGDAIAATVNAALARRDAATLPWLDGPPQTNETGRSAALMLGLMAIARRYGPKLEVLEIGSSAGLNLLIDRLGFELGGTRVGPADAPLVIVPEWRGAPPDPVPLEIVSVKGCDIQPLDATDPAVAARLKAYVWPEATERMARIEAAIAMQRARGVNLVQADAADWVEERLAEPQTPNVARVLMHSVVWQYLPKESAERIRTAMVTAGQQATEERPLGWVMMEPNREVAHQVIQVKSWPGDGKWQVLATAHAHGAWIKPGLAESDRRSYPLPESAKTTAG